MVLRGNRRVFRTTTREALATFAALLPYATYGGSCNQALTVHTVLRDSQHVWMEFLRARECEKTIFPHSFLPTSFLLVI